MGLKRKVSVWLVAALGPFGPGEAGSRGTCARWECRLIRRISVVTDEALTVGLVSRAVRLLRCAQVEVDHHGLLRSRCTHSRQRSARHQLSCSLPSEAERPIVERHPSAWSRTMKREARQSNATGRRSSETSRWKEFEPLTPGRVPTAEKTQK